MPEGSGNAPEVLSIARQALRDAAGDEALGEGGYEVHTTIDLSLQKQARGALQRGQTCIEPSEKVRGKILFAALVCK